MSENKIQTILELLKDKQGDSIKDRPGEYEDTSIKDRLQSIVTDNKMTVKSLETILDKTKLLNDSMEALDENQRSSMSMIFEALGKKFDNFADVSKKAIDDVLLEMKESDKKVIDASYEQVSLVKDIKEETLDTIDTSAIDENNKGGSGNYRDLRKDIKGVQDFLSSDMLGVIGKALTSFLPEILAVLATAGIITEVGRKVVDFLNPPDEDSTILDAANVQDNSGQIKDYNPGDEDAQNNYDVISNQIEKHPNQLASMKRYAETVDDKDRNINNMREADPTFNPNLYTVEGMKQYLAKVYGVPYKAPNISEEADLTPPFDPSNPLDLPDGGRDSVKNESYLNAYNGDRDIRSEYSKYDKSGVYPHIETDEEFDKRSAEMEQLTQTNTNIQQTTIITNISKQPNGSTE